MRCSKLSYIMLFEYSAPELAQFAESVFMSRESAMASRKVVIPPGGLRKISIFSQLKTVMTFLLNVA